MSNYIVEDELPSYYESKRQISKNNNTKIIFISIGVLIVLIFGIIITSRRNKQNYYSNLENEMVIRARDYNIGMDYTKESYFDANKLNINLPDNCNLLSGVINKGEEYIPYLVCSDYESKIVDNVGKIDLIGNDVILLLKDSEYYELGYHSPYDVQVSGNVDTSTEGVYNVYYISSNYNDVAIRKVIVVDNYMAESLLPTINIPNEYIELEIGGNYSDTVVAIDSNDGNITNKMIKANDINIYESGEYESVYSVTNSLGYTRMAMQKVLVLSGVDTSIIAKLSDEKMTNTNVNIMVKITGERFSYLILPDGTETNNREINYEVNENGEYEFVAVNIDDRKVIKSIKVSNIDRKAPSGTCNVTKYYDKMVFNVNVNSFNYIIGYNYIFNNKESGYISYNSYTVNEISNGNLSVQIKDYIGNVTSVDCSVTVGKSSIEPNGYTTLIRDKPRLHIPISEALAKRGYTVNDLNMCIYKRVKEAGPYTRYGVAAAAYGLIDCTYSMTGYVLPYDHSGGKVEGVNCSINQDICGKLGVNRRWGSSGGSCDSSQCWKGLNCATFVRWAMCNGGMDLCSKGEASAFSMSNVKYFPEADGVYIRNGSVSYYSGNNMTGYNANQLVRMIKPGDVLATSSHTFVIVGIDNNGVYTAEDGYFMRYLKYNDIIYSSNNYRILYLDRYYANHKNRNNLYN